MSSEKPLTEKQLLRKIEQKRNKVARMSARATQTINRMRLNDGINGSWKRFRNSCVSSGNVSAEEDKLKALEKQLDELRKTKTANAETDFCRKIEKRLQRKCNDRKEKSIVKIRIIHRQL